MIGDVLFDAAEDVQQYLDDPVLGAKAYPKGDALTQRIERLVIEMREVRILELPLVIERLSRPPLLEPRWN
ncbi:MAG TPA: hypothetical protein VGQ96_00420 [Candidatus Eremiobacteraceae bacterium]|nr:hypothetical protein [Candidatus Eremiobacteraceae bacterium]